MDDLFHSQISDILVSAQNLEYHIETNTKEENNRPLTFEQKLNSILKEGEKSPAFIGQLIRTKKLLDVQRKRLENLMDPSMKKLAQSEIGNLQSIIKDKKVRVDRKKIINIQDVLDEKIKELGGTIY